ncbi:MAG: nucleotidyltransferase domain-containing protein, partial [Selenomonadaceae bacterium]|nr:nucleotidyltransferase domain-containing protein [Selenomonadaceae bacterium]
MNAMPNLEIICDKVVDCYKKIYGDKIHGIYLYGSYARGDFDEDSDIDFAAIIDGERLDLQQKRQQLWDYTNDVDLDFDVLISPRVIPADEFDKY